MPNSLYNHDSGQPTQLSRGASAAIRSEFDAIATAFTTVETQLSAASAAADFKLIYQGALAEDPTQRWNGTQLQDGDLYFNTLANVMKSFAGGTWYALVTSSAAMLISGGTFTGAISGTAATFSGGVQAGGFTGNGSGLTNLTITQIRDALGYNPVNKAGDTMTGQLNGTNCIMSGTVQGLVVRQTSDERRKMKWLRISDDAIDRLAKLKKVGVFTDKKTLEQRVGIGAQSLAEIVPEAVSVDDKGILSVEYGPAAMVLIAQLAKRVVALEKMLEKRNDK